MAAGLKQNNIKPFDGVSWEDLYAIDAGLSTNFFTRSNLFVDVKQCADGTTIPIAYYTGSTAVDTSDLANFPKGAELHCSGITAPAIYIKTAVVGTNTWKYQVVNT